MTDRTFNVPEMSCGYCKADVEGEFSKLSGVERPNADLMKRTARSPTTRIG